MTHSIYGADRATHLKIVVVSLAAATLIAGVGIAARVVKNNAGVGVAEAQVHSRQVHGPIVKADKPVAVSSSEAIVVR